MKKWLCFIAFVSVRFIYCVVLIVFFPFFTQAQELSVRLYTAKDGLPSTYVYGSYQDKLGYLWVGTPEGLSRFDGKYFTNYGLSDGLPDIRTFGGFMDSRLRYWAATARGVVEFKGNRFINYPLSDSQNIRWVFQIFETKNGQVWSVTDMGVYQFNVNKWEKIKLYPGYVNHACRSILETNDGLYINYGDLLVLKKPTGTFKIIGPLKSLGYYYNTLIRSKDEIFISTLNGIYVIKNQQLIRLPGIPGRLRGIFSYFVDSKKRAWFVNNESGINVTAASDNTNIKLVYKPPLDIIPQFISEDNQANIWIACGIGLLRISDPGFKTYEVSAFGGKGIYNVLQPPTGPILINNGSLTIQAFENGIFTERKLQKKGAALTLNNELIIDDYAFDNKGRYWYNLRGWVLAMQDGNKLYEQNSRLAHLGDQVFDVLFDRYRNKIIMAVRTQNFPCQYYDSSFSVLPIANNINIKGEIRRLHQCEDGTILLATDGGLIYSIDKQNICRLQLNEFSTEVVISRFYNDPSGDTWILYSGRGLRRYTWHQGSLTFKEQITKANGLSTDNVSSMCFDNQNNLWISTNSDVAVFSNKTDAENDQGYEIVSFFDADNLQMEGAVDVQMIKDINGNIWRFSRKNLICFYPDKVNHKPPAPNIQIENVELNLRQTNWAVYADSLSGIFQLPYNLKLTHDNNNIGINFKGISSSGTEGIKYSYQLEGLQNSWSVPAASDFVSFVNLSPGKYNFKVKAQLLNSNWSAPALFSFTIKKAFWQTWWFYLLVGIALATGIYILFRYRLTQKLKLMEIRNRFSQDLHDEIGASMSGINLFSQMASEKLQQRQTEEATEYIDKVKNYTQDVIEKLSDMVWIFNPQNDSIEKLLERLRSLTLSIAASKNIQVHFETGKETETINLSIRQRKAIYLISKEAINNSFKYAACSNIHYSLNNTGSRWRLQIKDDGEGFIPAENETGNGLINMQARAAEINAIFSIQSQPGDGTNIILEF